MWLSLYDLSLVLAACVASCILFCQCILFWKNSDASRSMGRSNFIILAWRSDATKVNLFKGTRFTWVNLNRAWVDVLRIQITCFKVNWLLCHHFESMTQDFFFLICENTSLLHRPPWRSTWRARTTSTSRNTRVFNAERFGASSANLSCIFPVSRTPTEWAQGPHLDNHANHIGVTDKVKTATSTRKQKKQKTHLCKLQIVLLVGFIFLVCKHSPHEKEAIQFIL